MKTVPLHGLKGNGRTALVDDEDYDLVADYRWFLRENRSRATGRILNLYAVANTGGRGPSQVAMHRLITGWLFVDHADHNGLNNQRSNLRRADSRRNTQNARKRGGSGTTSQFKGVFWNKRERKWQSGIFVNGKRIYLGVFVSEEEAARVYDEAARRHFGEFACLNFAD